MYFVREKDVNFGGTGTECYALNVHVLPKFMLKLSIQCSIITCNFENEKI